MWFTEEDVINDFDLPLGRSADLNGHYVLGNAPPPRQIESTECEDQLEYWDALNARKSVQFENTKPDLNGITQLLRMVQDTNNENSDDEDMLQNRSNYIVISKKSALNPNVKEFVPTINNNNNKPESNMEKTNAIENGNTDVSTTTNNIEDESQIKEQLKDKISEASRSDTYEAKRRKNVAITSLLRLCAAKNANNAPKLLTPAHFTTEEVAECHNTTSEKTSSKTESPTVERATPSSSPSLGQGITTNEIPEVKKSIEKVIKWLDEPRAKDPPSQSTPYVGPIVFKRREAKPPVRRQDQHDQQNSPTNSQEWRPTSYATDLAKTYIENSTKEKPTDLRTNGSSSNDGSQSPSQTSNRSKKQRPINMWTDLEYILKERDILIKKRRENEAKASNGITNTDVSQ